jgi:hypothetical protein
MKSEYEYQNDAVLSVVEAFIGAIRPEVVAITVATSVEQRSLDLYVLATEDSKALRDELEEVELDLYAISSVAVIRSHLSIGSDWSELDWPGREQRPVFARTHQE